MTKHVEDLNKKYQLLCDEYVRVFAKKHCITFDSWIGFCDIAAFVNDNYYINLSDIIHDLTNDCPKGLILLWFEDCIENKDSGKYINFNSYAMGLRYEQLETK